MFVQGSQHASDGFAAPTVNPQLNLENLSAYFKRPIVNLPRFEGVDLPKPPTPAPSEQPFNPFGDEDGFDDFSSGALPATPQPTSFQQPTVDLFSTGASV